MKFSDILNNTEKKFSLSADENLFAEEKFSQFAAAAKSHKDQEIRKFIESLTRQKPLCDFLKFIFLHSPYLGGLVLRDFSCFKNIALEGFEKTFALIIKDLTAIDPENISREELMIRLRIAKQKVALTVALADVLAIWNLKQVTGSLSEFADLAVTISANFLLHQAHKRKQVAVADMKNPLKDSGLVILSLGKLGSNELNYSSDIDLMVFYDDKKNSYLGKDGLSNFFINLTQDMASILQTRTREGYVFRTDLRLRPDPGSTPPAIAISTAENYYETVGQNWERAAMIKARPVAADAVAAEKFMHFIGRYVWRKYLDFASIQDIHSIKRQIDNKIGELPEDLMGYNIKLGHGGIREIEFFVQTQQLIWGGREKSLQLSATCDALDELARLRRISKKACDDLKSAYILYRTIEHRLQMVDDQQTHTLPQTKESLNKIARFLGYETTEQFVGQLKSTIFLVKGYYSELFNTSPSLASDKPGIQGSLVFTGIEDDPETLKTLAKMGFSDPSMVSETVRSWHHGRRRATRTKRAREILTELMPILLKAFANSINPDAGFKKFDEFLTKLPSGVQLFSLFFANPELITLIAEIMGGYPYIANNLSRKPVLLEYVLALDFYEKIPDFKTLDRELRSAIGRTDNFEDILNITRSWSHEKQFRVGIQLIKGKITTEETCTHLTSVADAVLGVLCEETEKYFISQQGALDGFSFAVIGMGKLGSQELTFGSDLDLVFVYGKDKTGKFGGKKSSSLSPAEYFARLSKRFVSSISSLTTEGKLYEVDLRLRPSGKDGPIVSSLEGLVQYYLESAWGIEHIALTRARVVYATPSLKKELEAEIRKILTMRRDKKQLAQNISEIREKSLELHSSKNIFDVKRVKGGLMDLELAVQFLQLANSHGMAENMDILDGNTVSAITKLNRAEIIGAKEKNLLLESVILFKGLQSVLRLMNNDSPDETTLPDSIKKAITQIMGYKSFAELKKKLEKSQKNVQKLYGDLI